MGELIGEERKIVITNNAGLDIKDVIALIQEVLVRERLFNHVTKTKIITKESGFIVRARANKTTITFRITAN